MTDDDPYASIAQALQKAWSRLENFDYHGAADALASGLRSVDPATAAHDKRLLNAADLFVTHWNPPPGDLSVPRWAWYLYRAAPELPETTDEPLALAKLEGLYPAGTLLSVGQEAIAARLLAAGHHGLHLEIRMEIATTYHTDGYCAASHEQATTALRTWQPHHHTTPTSSISYLTDALALLDQCGRLPEASALLAEWTPDLTALSPANRAFAIEHGDKLRRAPTARDAHRRECTAPSEPTSQLHEADRPSDPEIHRLYLAALTSSPNNSTTPARQASPATRLSDSHERSLSR